MTPRGEIESVWWWVRVSGCVLCYILKVQTVSCTVFLVIFHSVLFFLQRILHVDRFRLTICKLWLQTCTAMGGFTHRVRCLKCTVQLLQCFCMPYELYFKYQKRTSTHCRGQNLALLNGQRACLYTKSRAAADFCLRILVWLQSYSTNCYIIMRVTHRPLGGRCSPWRQMHSAKIRDSLSY
jgi:hypothetical protein